MSLSPVRLRDGLLQPNRLSGGRIGGGGQSPRDAILATASPATLAYVQAVEAADGNIQLENAVLAAMVTFANYRIPLGGACCLMAGARTLAGALVPMVGAAPDPVNFVTGDYDRVTGLAGDGIGKYLDSNRAGNADAQNNVHIGVFVTTADPSGTKLYMGGSSANGGFSLGVTSGFVFTRNQSSAFNISGTTSTATGLLASARSEGASYGTRFGSNTATVSITSQGPAPATINVFTQDATPFTFISGARLSMYSIGPNVDLTAMDTAITTAMDAIDRAINPLRYAILDAFSVATRNYLLAVEAADGQQLENTVLAAMGSFAEYRIPLGGACCLMAGARTLAGALVPMVGAAPTNFNFVAGDYNRVTGLAGDGIGKYLNSNRNNNADPQDNRHIAVWQSAIATTVSAHIVFGTANITGATRFVSFNPGTVSAVVTGTSVNIATMTTGFLGASRSNGSSAAARNNSTPYSASSASVLPTSENLGVFGNSYGVALCSARLSMYSIGPAVDLTAMDTAITTCMNALAAAGI